MSPRTLGSRLRTATTLLGLTSLGLVVTPALPAGAVAVDQSYRVPDSGTFTVRGHGYGHGRGMSQHGAQGAALKGLTHEQILAFYYPGTDLGTAKHKIRIRITADSTRDLIVLPAPGLAVRDRGTMTLHPLPTNLGATRWKLDVTGDNKNAVFYEANGWKQWKPGNQATLVGEGAFVASGPLTLVTPSGQRSYRGSLRATAPSAGSTDRDTVNVLSLDNYVRGVVAREMPASWSPEAVQSQAVAARTYAAWHRAQYKTRYYDLCDTTACQVYGGLSDEHPLADAAVTATARQVLRYGGTPAFTQFSASSGGWITAGTLPYQVAKADPYDGWSGNTSHTWTVKLKAATIQKRYPAIGKLKRIRVISRDGNGEWKGRILKLVLDGTKRDRTISGDEFRFGFGLKSTWLTLR